MALVLVQEDASKAILIDPMRVLLEPITREAKLIKLRSSLNNIEAISDAEVDALIDAAIAATGSAGPTAAISARLPARSMAGPFATTAS